MEFTLLAPDLVNGYMRITQDIPNHLRKTRRDFSFVLGTLRKSNIVYLNKQICLLKATVTLVDMAPTLKYYSCITRYKLNDEPKKKSQARRWCYSRAVDQTKTGTAI